MKELLKINEVEIKPEILDVIKNSWDDEKTKANDFQSNVYNNFNYAAVRQVEKFL